MTPREFLDCRRIAVAGVSRGAPDAANHIYRKLRACGYQVFAINPNTETVEGDVCYPSVGAIPGGVEAVMIATHPAVSAEIVRQCADSGVKRAWLHRSFGQGSVSEDAVRLGSELGVNVIDGACPMMYLEPVDVPHRCMKWVLRTFGKLPN